MNISKLANFKILLSYKSLYSSDKNILDIVSTGMSINEIKLLSLLCYSEKKYDDLKLWYQENYEITNEKVNEIKSNSLTSRKNIYKTWKYILSSKITDTHTYIANENLKRIFDSFIAVNDIPEPEHIMENYFLKGYVFQYRDKVLSQFYRSYMMFTKSDIMKPFTKDFKQNYGIEIKDYIYIIHYINVRLHHLRQDILSNKTNMNNIINHWHISYEALSNEISISESDFDTVMNMISFRIKEGHEFCQNSLNDENNINLFRNRPFFEIEKGIYIPIEGSLSENLLFNNLFYRVKDMYQGNSKFLQEFGYTFEKYLSQLARKTLSQRGVFSIIDEFYYNNTHKSKNKSSDFYIYDKRNNTIVVFEVKSARIFNSFDSSYNNKDSYEESIKKLFFHPINQAIETTSKIVKLKAHPLITKEKKYFFVSITMNSFPYNLAKFTSEINDKDININFLNMSVETFEKFIKVISIKSSYSIRDIFLEYNIKYKDIMSFKTFLVRIEKHMGKNNKRMDNIFLQSQNDFKKTVKL